MGKTADRIAGFEALLATLPAQIMGGIKEGVKAAIPPIMKILTFIALLVTYPATPFLFILSLQLKQVKAIFYSERQL